MHCLLGTKTYMFWPKVAILKEFNNKNNGSYVQHILQVSVTLTFII
jgi:hypothetical protein